MPQREQPAALSSSSLLDPTENLENTQILFVNRLFTFFLENFDSSVHVKFSRHVV